MFQRRVLVLAACAMIVNILLLFQLLRLAIFEGEQHRGVAEARLKQQDWLPTWRGAILDRQGRELAIDEPAYDVAFAYEAITGSWAEQRAVKAARDSVGRTRWNSLGPEQRESLINLHLETTMGKLDAFWDDVASASGKDAEVLEAARNDVLARVQHMAAVVWEQQRFRHEARFSEEGGGPAFRARPIAEQEAFHVLLPAVTDEEAIVFKSLELERPELIQVRHARKRAYPHERRRVVLDRSMMPRGLQSWQPLTVNVEGVGDHLIGRVRRPVWEEDVLGRPFRDPTTGQVDRGGYLLDDEVGASGAESGWERHLRGIRGSLASRRDVDEEIREAPQPGKDLQLTIDIMLQGRIESVLSPVTGMLAVQPWHGNEGLDDGRELNASVVVLEIETGEILAMVSSPNQASLDSMTGLEQQVRMPWMNRAVEGVYPPGSIIKPLVLAAAVTGQVHDLAGDITCKGHHFPGQSGIARCWIYRAKNGYATHGSLQAEEALARSCNCFFYALGDQLGLDELAQWLRYFGVGRVLDTGLAAQGADGPEAAGSLPGPEEISRLHRDGESRFESVMLAIGQGRVTWTPLHAANSYAIIARQGRRLPPTIVKGFRSTPPGPDITLDPEVVQAILTGLEDAVTERHGTGSRIRYGTGDFESIFNVDPIRVWGKTGTAQSPPLRSDVDGNGQLEPGEQIEGLHHAWFVGYAGTDVPRYAIAVLVEHGGSGGRAAGPIANQVVHGLLEEGYFDDVEVRR